MEKQKKDKIKRAVIHQPLAEGGLNFINFATMVKSLRLAWISRLLGDTDDSWKVIPNSYLSEYGGLQFLLKCIYNAESIIYVENCYNISKKLKTRPIYI